METLPEKAAKSTSLRGKLSTEEAARLKACETVIRAGLQNFVEVGNALLEVGDKRLYRETHSTFKEYVEDVWKMSVRQAYRLCESAEVIKALPENCVQLVTTESQARELAKVEPEKRVKVIEEAKERGPVTAKAIKVVVEAETKPKEISPARMTHDQISDHVLSEYHNMLGTLAPGDVPRARNILRTLLAKEPDEVQKPESPDPDYYARRLREVLLDATMAGCTPKQLGQILRRAVKRLTEEIRKRQGGAA